MNRINLSQIDLNLLVALDALLREQSVTKAARVVGVGQSAMSHSLARLRELFGDPLFVRAGRGIEATPRAASLVLPLRETLLAIHRVLSDGGPFDPARSTRGFRLACSDLLAAFLPELLAAISVAAPGVTLEVASTSAAGSAAALRAGDADLALSAPEQDTASCRQRALGTVGWVVLARADHPIAGRRLSRAAYARYPHIMIRTGSRGGSFVGEALAAAGVKRKVGLVLPSFLAAPFAVARSELLFTAPDKLLAPLVSLLDLTTAKPPVPIPKVPVVAIWPDRLDADRAQRWFRDTVSAVVGDLLTAEDGSA